MNKNLISDIRFFEGGKAIFTVSNNKNEHYTYKIVKKTDKPFFVFLLTGPDNNSSYSYLGVYVPQYLRIKLTQKSRFKEDSTPVKVISWAIKKVASKTSLPEGYAIQHENKCCRCGRRLTTPESIENGIGPECIKFWRN